MKVMQKDTIMNKWLQNTKPTLSQNKFYKYECNNITDQIRMCQKLQGTAPFSVMTKYSSHTSIDLWKRCDMIMDYEF